MPVAAGGLSTRLAASETNRVPRRRSSRTMGGWAVGLMGGIKGIWVVGFGRTAPPPICPSAQLLLATTRPPALQAHDTRGLVSGFGAAFGTSRGLGSRRWRGRLGLADSHTHPNITRRSCSATPALGRLYVAPPPEVHGDAQQHEDQTQERVRAGRVLYEQIDGDEAGQRDVEGRQDGIAWGFDGTRDVGPSLPQSEDSNRRDGVEDHRSEDHEVEQLSVGARQTEDAGPNRLDDQCQRG